MANGLGPQSVILREPQATEGPARRETLARKGAGSGHSRGCAHNPRTCRSARLAGPSRRCAPFRMTSWRMAAPNNRPPPWPRQTSAHPSVILREPQATEGPARRETLARRGAGSGHSRCSAHKPRTCQSPRLAGPSPRCVRNGSYCPAWLSAPLCSCGGTRTSRYCCVRSLSRWTSMADCS